MNGEGRAVRYLDFAWLWRLKEGRDMTEQNQWRGRNGLSRTICSTLSSRWNGFERSQSAAIYSKVEVTGKTGRTRVAFFRNPFIQFYLQTFQGFFKNVVGWSLTGIIQHLRRARKKLGETVRLLSN
jgi:hypothetical protein